MTIDFIKSELTLHTITTTPTTAFAAWFVDRKVSCFTNLVENEIVMNNGIVPYNQSREPRIYLEVTPLDNKTDKAGPNSHSEYHQKISDVLLGTYCPVYHLVMSLIIH